MSLCRRIGQDPQSTEYELVLDQFDDYALPLELTTGAGTVADPELPLDCTGATVTWEIRRNPTSELVTQFTIDWISRTGGTATASIYADIPCGKTPRDIASLYFHHLVFVDSLGHRRTLAKGPCIVNRGVDPDAI